MTFPNDRGVAGLREALSREAERGIPTPRIRADNLHALSGEMKRRRPAHAAAGVDITRLGVAGARARIDEDDIKWRQAMLNPVQLGINIIRGRDIAVRQVTEVEFDTGLHAPVQWQFIDGGRPRAAIHG